MGEPFHDHTRDTDLNVGSTIAANDAGAAFTLREGACCHCDRSRDSSCNCFR